MCWDGLNTAATEWTSVEYLPTGRVARLGLPEPCGLGQRASGGGGGGVRALRDRALHLLRHCAALARPGPRAIALEGAGPGRWHHDTMTPYTRPPPCWAPANMLRHMVGRLWFPLRVPKACGLVALRPLRMKQAYNVCTLWMYGMHRMGYTYKPCCFMAAAATRAGFMFCYCRGGVALHIG